MTFEMYYAGEILNRQITYSTKEGRNSKWKEWSEFYKKMDALAKEIKTMKKEEENNLVIEEKVFDEKDGMVALVQKIFTQQMLDDGDDGGDENYKTHEDNGRLQVNGEKIDNYKDFFGNAYEEWEKALKERLDKLDWHVVYSMTYSGFHNNGDWDGIEGEFDKKKIKLKDTCIYYDDEPIAQPDGCEWHRDVVLYVNATGDEFSMDIELEWAEDEEEEE